MKPDETTRRGDELRKAGDNAGAIEAYLEAIKSDEQPDGDVCLKLARCCERQQDYDSALHWLMQVVDSSDSFLHWQSAAASLTKLPAHDLQQGVKRTARAALLGSYTTSQLVPMIALAARRWGIALEVYEAPYGQYQQEILDPGSGLYAFEPDFVILALHAGELALPRFAESPAEAVATEVDRWRMLWEALDKRSTARMIMHNFALPFEAPMGNLTGRLPGARESMMRQVNHALGEAAGNAVSIVDCDRLSSVFGKARWFDDKYYHIAKQAVSLDSLPVLAKHTAAVLAADLGLSRKCLVLDLDNTLWGGVIGEDGLAGIRLGAGPEGEAFVAFQEYILELKNKGVILAVCSKNNDADAKEPFTQHPDMRIALDDIAIFVANWRPKSDNIKFIAETLNIGLDSLVFVDDNPAEREVIRQHLPEVEVITLPADPTGYRRALAGTLWFETASFTQEDAGKTEQYKAKAEIAQLETSAGSLEEFHRSLDMRAIIAPFDDLHLPRIVQLIGKTNQFNLTTRRHTMQVVREFMSDPDCVHFYLKLQDRFTDHGLVSMLIARRDGEVMDIDTFLMSCRVIGRTVEAEMLAQLCERAAAAGCAKLRGTYIPTAKNVMVKDLYSRFGFTEVAATGSVEEAETVWEYDLSAAGPIVNGFIEPLEDARDAA
ncbi:MAG: HAD-IIIC family phosphatase [Phycisphaerales bacterium]|nr:MAG: HAD-IIIC family phosphatase [Phycisphaerales bacterium]